MVFWCVSKKKIFKISQIDWKFHFPHLQIEVEHVFCFPFFPIHNDDAERECLLSKDVSNYVRNTHWIFFSLNPYLEKFSFSYIARWLGKIGFINIREKKMYKISQYLVSFHQNIHTTRSLLPCVWVFPWIVNWISSSIINYSLSLSSIFYGSGLIFVTICLIFLLTATAFLNIVFFYKSYHPLTSKKLWFCFLPILQTQENIEW